MNDVRVSGDRYETEGYALAMRVMQSALYCALDERERAECDEFIRRGQALAPEKAEPTPLHVTPKGRALSPDEAVKMASAGNEKAVAGSIRSVMQEHPKAVAYRWRSPGSDSWHLVQGDDGLTWFGAGTVIEPLYPRPATDEAVRHLRRVLDAYFTDTGAEPSVSVLARAAVEAQEFLASQQKGIG